MATPRRVTPSTQVLDTPPITPESTTAKNDIESVEAAAHQQMSGWTPPSSPQFSRSVAEGLFGLGLHTAAKKTSIWEDRWTDGVRSDVAGSSIDRVPQLYICPFDVEYATNESGQRQIFGKGAWSTVYRALPKWRPSSMLPPTPPTSHNINPPSLVAVKMPICHQAVSILHNEGLVLAHVATIPNFDSFVVSFLGIIPSTTSLVLSAVPLSLEMHIKTCASRASANMSTWTMMEPVIGSPEAWLSLACQLISALAWLHGEADVVHGDVKPGNILLRTNHESNSPSSSLAISDYQPLFTDFSSSQRLSSHHPSPNTLSAVTREYTAPELLSSEVLRNPLSTATPASDIFSLAVTLLAGATGNTMVYDGSAWQRQAMARQGWDVISHVRNGPPEAAMRVPPDGVVQRVCEPAVLKSDRGRIEVTRWRGLVEGMKRAAAEKNERR